MTTISSPSAELKLARRDDENLVIVSNRLPYNLPEPGAAAPPRRNVGGLVNAVEPGIGARRAVWIGWDGSVLPNLAAVQQALRHPRSFTTETGALLFGAPMSERELARHYHGYCNRALWPLFHDFVDKAVFQPDEYAFYERVNRRFAALAVAAADDDGRIWVHDFHLLPAPRFIRELGFKGRIDFFLHVPFPPAEIFRVAPQRDDLMRGMLAADTVSFHVLRYRDNFVGAAQSLGLARALPRSGDVLLAHGEGVTVAAEAPIGADVESFEKAANNPAVQTAARRLRSAHGGRPILFSADRLDYTKGIRERLAAIERFFERHGEFLGRVDFIQVVVPSRHQVEEYRQLKRDIDREVGRINGLYGRDGWVPIHYRYRMFDRAELAAHFLAATAAVITPLRDGMNLVASEFIATRVDGDGVVLVSEFAGVADRLPGALLVNPYDVDGVVDAMHQALTMPADERRERIARLSRRVRATTATAWVNRCLSLNGAAPL